MHGNQCCVCGAMGKFLFFIIMFIALNTKLFEAANQLSCYVLFTMWWVFCPAFRIICHYSGITCRFIFTRNWPMWTKWSSNICTEYNRRQRHISPRINSSCRLSAAKGAVQNSWIFVKFLVLRFTLGLKCW